MTPEQLLDAWTHLACPDAEQHLAARELAPDVGLWVAVDSDGHRHLLVEVAEGTLAPRTETHGLHVSVGRHRVADRAPAVFVDLECQEEGVFQTFAAVAAEVAKHVITVPDVESRADLVAEAMNRWRWFWDIDPDKLTSSDALGLFAELWFLIQWVGVRPDTVQAWQSTEGARHDFQWPDLSVEVKATSRRRSGHTIHHIQHLDQLADPESGELLLFSMRVAHDALARNTLATLISTVLDQLHDPVERDSFLRKLGRRGYTPAASAHSDVAYRVQEEDLYSIVEHFPRLTARSFVSGPPPAIGDISYTLDMSACQQWKIASSPSDWRRP